MINLNDVTAEYDRLDKYARADILDTADDVMEKINELPAGYSAPYVFCEFLIGSCLTREMDYLVMRPMLERIFGEGNDYNAVKDKLRKEGKDGLRKVFRVMGDILEALDEQSGKKTLMLAVSVIYGQYKFSMGGRKYLKRFAKELASRQ
ncbi:MAG: hypothetical protein LUE27_02135 [Clostridia bacterium]|nr:hypothetical protein [Clostridia bacterium]